MAKDLMLAMNMKLYLKTLQKTIIYYLPHNTKITTFRIFKDASRSKSVYGQLDKFSKQILVVVNLKDIS